MSPTLLKFTLQSYPLEVSGGCFLAIEMGTSELLEEQVGNKRVL